MDANVAIDIFDTCFKVCLSFTIFFLILSVALFFIFDIKAIYSIRTGSAKRKTIKEMQAANDTTGRLRVGNKTLTSKLPKGEAGRTRGPVIVPPTKAKTDNYSNAGGANETEVLQDNPTELLQDNPTEVLNEQFAQTEVLGEQIAQTEVLSQMHYYNERTAQVTMAWDNAENEAVIKEIAFEIVKKEMFIHTDEQIY
ncbi:MAG: hypothetical protein IJO20_08025 [Ruminococcus sp.]|nr:hypothetical protein [Ruminococcus sp.]